MTNPKIKFHLDENVDGAIVKGLRLRNIDVTTTEEANLIGASDEQQAAYALNENRIIFTHDDDFLRLNNREIEHAGIIYCRQGSRSVGEILRSLELIRPMRINRKPRFGVKLQRGTRCDRWTCPQLLPRRSHVV